MTTTHRLTEPLVDDPAAPEEALAKIEVGDYVTIGDNDLTWEVTFVYANISASVLGPLVRIVSGQTGRERYEPLARLTIHTKREDIAA